MWFKEQNGQLKTPPVNFVTQQGTIMNFNKNPQKLLEYGYKQYTQPEYDQYLIDHPQASAQPTLTQDFVAACAQFRQICHQIGTAIGNSDFKGGFDEMQEFASSPVYGTIQGLKLGLAWSAANENCKYEGSKSGYGQPQWWFKCWELEESNNEE